MSPSLRTLGKRLSVAGALVVGLAFAPVSVWAQNRILVGDNVKRITELLAAQGSARVERDPEGDPLIRGEIGGINYDVYFYGCSDGRNCETLVFSAYWEDHSADVEIMDAWNAQKRFGVAYIDEDDTATLDMTLLIGPGITEANFQAAVQWWKKAVTEYKEFLP